MKKLPVQGFSLQVSGNLGTIISLRFFQEKIVKERDVVLKKLAWD
jgi:hypothetical protein